MPISPPFRMEAMNNQSSEIIYTYAGPRTASDTGPFVKTRLMIREFIDARELIIRLFIRNFSSKYRQSVLGIVWAFIIPIITVGMFMVMGNAGVINVQGLKAPYAVYAIIGTTFFNLFTAGLTACTGSIVQAGSMIVKINFPRIALVFSSSLMGIVDTAVRLILIAAAFIVYRTAPHPVGVLIGFLSLIPLFILTLGLGLFFSLVAAILRDLINIIPFATMGLMLLTPVLYPIDNSSALGVVTQYNPLHYLINFPRDMVLYGSSELTTGYIVSSIISCIVLIAGWQFFYMAQTKIAERV
ncbi:MAG: ABC transporter permease [Candidatus Auribacterota bacterium]